MAQRKHISAGWQGTAWWRVKMSEQRELDGWVAGRPRNPIRAPRHVAPTSHERRSSSERRPLFVRARRQARSRAPAPRRRDPAAARHCPLGPAGRRAPPRARDARRPRARPRKASVALTIASGFALVRAVSHSHTRQKDAFNCPPWREDQGGRGGAVVGGRAPYCTNVHVVSVRRVFSY